MEVKECSTEYDPALPAAAIPSGDGPFTYQWGNGASTATTQYTAAPAGDSVHVWVAVKDLVENRTRTVSKWVRTVTMQDPDYVYCLST